MNVLLFNFIFIFALASNAAQSLSTKINNPYSSIRALGMGNAFSAVADDYSLIMYNPAGFARKKHNEIQMTLLGAGVSSKTLTIADDVKKASDTVGTDAEKAQAVSDVLEKYYGQSLGGKLQAMEIFWVRNGWGIALLPMDLTIDMSINKQLGPAIDLNVKGDTSIAFGIGKEITQYIDAGLTAKYVHRVSVEEIVPAFELAVDPNVLSDKRFREGTKADFDLGIMWRPNWFGSSEKINEVVKTEPKAEIGGKDSKTEELKTNETQMDKKTGPTEQATEQNTESIMDANAKPDGKSDGKSDIKSENERKPQSEDNVKGSGVEESSSAQTTTLSKDEALGSKDQPKKEAMAPTAVENSATVNEKLKPFDPKAVGAKAIETKDKTSESETPGLELSSPEKEEYLPLTFGLVVHNVIGGEFTLSKQVNKNATEVPTKLHRVIDIGSQYMLRDGEDFKIRYMLDFKNILHPEISLNKSFHTGIEFDYSPNTWFKTQFRAGLNQMYYTAGASLLFAVINIDVVTYGEEVGTATTKLENRVLAAKLGFSF